MHVIGNELATVARARDGRRVLVEQVDLLERETLGFRDAEVRKDHATCARRTPDEEDLHPKVGATRIRVDEVWCREGDSPVPQPEMYQSTARLDLGRMTDQFDATESDMAFARMLSGKISPVMTQAMGPQVDANAAIYMQTRAMSAL